MRRLRLLLALTGIVLIVAIGPIAFAQEETTVTSTETTVVAPTPAVVVDSTPAVTEDEAWTFRFLVPTLAVLTGLALVGSFAAYGVRVRARYRVAR